jgi:hypothetical protein
MNIRFSLSPVAAWFILAGAVATLFPLRLEHIQMILAATALLAAAWLPGRRLRSAPFLLVYLITAALALKVSLPLPGSSHPVASLLLVLAVWAIVLIIPLSSFMYYLFRTAATKPGNEPSRTSQQSIPPRGGSKTTTAR